MKTDAPARGPNALDDLTDVARMDLRRAGTLAVVSSLLWIVQAASVAWLIEDLVQTKTFGAGTGFACLLFALFGVLRALLDHRAGNRLFRACDTVIARVRAGVLERETRRSPMDPARPGSAATAALLAEKTQSLQPYLVRYTPARMRTMVVPLTIVLVTLPFSWIAALILLITGPLIPVFMALIGMAAKTASEQQLQQIGTLNDALLDRLHALSDIRLLDAGSHTLAQFRRHAESLQQRTMAVLRIAFLSSTVLELFAAIGVAMLALYIGFVLLGEIRFGYWDTPFGLAEGIFMLMLAPEFFQPMRDLATAWHDRAAAQAVADELVSASTATRIEIPGNERAGQNALAVGVAASTPLLQTRALRWQTPGGHTIAFPDLDIAHGERVALVGPSGSGKSTLLALLAGLLPIRHGQILLAGQSLRDDNADAWRACFGWMSQSPWFLDGTLADNLRLGNPTAPIPRLQAALATASIDELLDKLPHKLQTRLGETGSGVSGGEARRLMLARLLSAGCPIMLADEPTSDLDAETAALVTAGLLNPGLSDSGGQTSTLIIATHDTALMHRVDRIVSLEDQA